MIRFKCWYCNKTYHKPEVKIRTRFLCTCKHTLKVPRRDNGNCRTRTALDWLIEIVVYGGGGALLGFLFGLLIVSRIFLFWQGKRVILLLTLAGFLFGVIGGERGINLIGRWMRDRSEST